MVDIAQQLAQVHERIAQAEQRFNRVPGSVSLLAATKTCSPEAILTAASCGQRVFGENYLQEGLTKIEALKKENFEWHFIGPIQSNKTRDIASHFSWVHSIDRLKVARRLSDQRPSDLGVLNICLQVKISDETSKSGVLPEDLIKLAKEVALIPNLSLRGLMTVPAITHDFEEQRKPFKVLYNLWCELRNIGFELDILSIGMTDDLEAAIAEGATLVRVGTAIFGSRPQKSA
ncbi:YggS family pyridoxal phosphate-dependent enzyme [Candidatus Nitrosacidococcus sp. I8]|uniref:YggS family pyridoxal phosphate-dependent enzyme n=1 Tax=Candidatus Nitrosacidococcus sp. I8 TaxID=2942908 RepID=UPI002227550F|nr:YggS family pyridoxal phosphate-dependent enzyme [Candidatus Nitrosacidococcus sp. I8]CAH9019800.1 Pyridoxal phosphate homeostasis protein [Candidatus Nitrosacidococcus sp. I8]